MPIAIDLSRINGSHPCFHSRADRANGHLIFYTDPPTLARLPRAKNEWRNLDICTTKGTSLHTILLLKEQLGGWWETAQWV